MVSMTIFPFNASAGNFLYANKGIAATIILPAFAASTGVPASANGPNCAINTERDSFPLELLIKTLNPAATANLAIVVPIGPLPIIPIVRIIIQSFSFSI